MRIQSINTAKINNRQKTDSQPNFGKISEKLKEECFKRTIKTDSLLNAKLAGIIQRAEIVKDFTLDLTPKATRIVIKDEAGRKVKGTSIRIDGLGCERFLETVKGKVITTEGLAFKKIAEKGFSPLDLDRKFV